MNPEKVNHALDLPYLKKIASEDQFFFQVAQDKLKEWLGIGLLGRWSRGGLAWSKYNS